MSAFANTASAKSASTLAAIDLRLARLALSTHDRLHAAGSAAVSGDASAGGQILLVSSARAGEGKSFVAQSLARQWVDQHRDDVLLLSVQLAGSSAPGALPRGLGEWLITAELPGTQRSATSLPICHRLAAPGGVVAASLFQLAAIDAALMRLRPHYASIIIDAPPLADCGVLPRLADATLLVVDASRTPAHAVQTALSEARLPEGRFAGVVLNRQPRALPRWLGG
jgi:succinoglycan biosynthesis transport protein ExoP